MADLSTLIFDVDGTLADTEREGHRVAFNLAFADAGLDWHWSETLYGALLSVAGGKERLQFFIERYRPNGLDRALVVDSPALADFIARLHQAKTEYYAQLIADGKISPRPGVVRLIHEARDAGVRLAIATTSAPDNAIALLKTILHPDAPAWFEVIAAGDIVASKKPAPDIYQYVLREMALSLDECLVIEDSAQGLQAAVQAGLRAIITLNGYTQTQDFSGALLVLNHLGEPNEPVRAIASQCSWPDLVSQHSVQYINLDLLRAIHHQAVNHNL